MCLYKGAGHPGFQSEWVGTTWFRRLPEKDSCFEGETTSLLFLQSHRETDRFFCSFRNQLAQSDHLHFRRAVFLAQFKSRVGLILTKTTTLRITLNLDGTSITSTTHTHPSYSQTSRLSTSSLTLGVPVPRGTQCM